MNISKKKNYSSSNSGCFTSILEKLICTGNLPTHPLPPREFLEKNNNPKKDTNNVCNDNGSGDVVVDRSRVQGQGQGQGQTQASPGIVARLMGLDSLPSNDSLFRSKSLNSLHFLPDFDPTRAAFHRRARTSSASFHEQGQGQSFLDRIDECSENSSVKMKEPEQVGRGESKQKKEKREKAVNLKGNECSRSVRKDGESGKRYQESYYKSNCSSTVRSNSKLKNTGVGKNVVSNSKGNSREKGKNMKVGLIVTSKKKVDRKHDLSVEVQSDASSRSPVSVLDHHHEFDLPSRSDDANPKQITSSSGRRSTRKIKIVDDMPVMPSKDEFHPKYNKNDDESSNTRTSKHKLQAKEDPEVTEYFAELSGQICAFAEEQLCKDLARDNRKFQLFKNHFLEDLCQDFGEEMLNFLLNELTDELV